MGFTDDLQTSFDDVVNIYGTPVTPWTYSDTIGSWGDATTTYTSGADVIMIVQPVRSEEQIIATFGERAEGEMIAFAKSGVSVVIGNKYTYKSEDYELVKKKEWIMSGVTIYNELLWNRIDDD